MQGNKQIIKLDSKFYADQEKISSGSKRMEAMFDRLKRKMELIGAEGTDPDFFKDVKITKKYECMATDPNPHRDELEANPDVILYEKVIQVDKFDVPRKNENGTFWDRKMKNLLFSSQKKEIFGNQDDKKIKVI